MLAQIPYYIPPVMFANLINIIIFAVMIGCLEVLPTILYGLFGAGKGPTDANNITDMVPEISGKMTVSLKYDGIYLLVCL